MVTFTIGFSNDSIPKRQFRPIGKTATELTKSFGTYWIDTNITKDWPKRKDDPLWQWDGPFLAGNKSTNMNDSDKNFYFETTKDSTISKYYGDSDKETDNGNNGLLISPSSTLPYGYDGSFADYAAGRAQWYSVKGGEAGQDM